MRERRQTFVSLGVVTAFIFGTIIGGFIALTFMGKISNETIEMVDLAQGTLTLECLQHLRESKTPAAIEILESMLANHIVYAYKHNENRPAKEQDQRSIEFLQQARKYSLQYPFKAPTKALDVAAKKILSEVVQ